jgi:hypothetical protein
LLFSTRKADTGTHGRDGARKNLEENPGLPVDPAAGRST